MLNYLYPKVQKDTKELTMIRKEDLPACPVATTVQLIGNKWKLLILRNLMTKTHRFNELKKTIPGISQKVLTDNLRDLEASQIVKRTVYPVIPPKVEYELTDIGESMRPIIKDMELWGLKYKASLLE